MDGMKSNLLASTKIDVNGIIESAARVVSDQPEFIKPPVGMLSEQIDLDDFGLVLGLIHPDGSPLMIAAWDGKRLRRLLPEQASKWADELVEAGQAEALALVIAAIRKLVRRVGDIVTASIMNTAGNA